MVGAPVTIGMRVLSSDGAELGLVDEVETDRFVVRDPTSEVRQQFRYTDIRSVGAYVQLAAPPKSSRRRRLVRGRQKPREI